MNGIENAIIMFDSGELNKITAVELMAGSLDERVVALFLRELRDKSEDDLVRIEILKSLPVREDTPINQELFGEGILQILQGDDDDLVRQFAAKSMRGFVTCDGAVTILERIIRNESDDIDVRHNALSAIETNASLPNCRDALVRLVQVPVLGESAERTLRRLSQ